MVRAARAAMMMEIDFMMRVDGWMVSESRDCCLVWSLFLVGMNCGGMMILSQRWRRSRLHIYWLNHDQLFALGLDRSKSQSQSMDGGAEGTMIAGRTA
jgi:hypothetical protein